MARPVAHTKIDLMMALKGLGLVATLILALGSAYGAYYSILGRLDRVDQQMTAQGEQLKALADSIKTLATEALNPGDLLAYCLQSQISNRGWVCPLAQEANKPAASRTMRRAVQLNKASVP